MNLINPAESCPAIEDHMHINFFFQFSDTENSFDSFRCDVKIDAKKSALYKI